MFDKTKARIKDQLAEPVQTVAVIATVALVLAALALIVAAGKNAS